MDSTVLNDPFVYVAENILTPEKCSEIIDRFEKDKMDNTKWVVSHRIDLGQVLKNVGGFPPHDVT